MEFITKNIINTSTQISITSGSLTSSNIISRDITKQYITSGFDNDLTTSTMIITLDNTTNVSRIILDGINLKSFTIFYNGATANTFNLTSTGATTVSDFSTNSETAMYLVAATAQVSSVTIDMKTTQTANAEKAIGWLALADSKLVFDRVPASKNYKPKVKSNEVLHKMSDKTTRVTVKNRYHEVNIKYKFITESFRDGLKEVFDDRDEFIFVAFGTTTSWDTIAFPAIWQGDFNFFEYSDDATTAGFSGQIKIMETSS